MNFKKIFFEFALIVIFILSFTKVLNSQTFVKSYDFPPVQTKTDIGRSIQLDLSTQESWSIAGYTNSGVISGSYDWMFMRLDKNGFVKCTAISGLPYDDSCYSHVQLTTPNYVLAGFYSIQNLRPKASFSIFDTSCNHLITKQIADTSRSTYTQVIRSYQSLGFALTGFIEKGNMPNSRKFMVSQYSNQAVLTWGFIYMPLNPMSSEEAYSICYQQTDNTYAVTGRTNTSTGSNLLYDVFVSKISANGGPIWFKIYKFGLTNVNSEAKKIIPMADGGFVIIGWTNANDAGSSNVWIFRINTAGFLNWSYVLGTAGKIDKGYSVILGTDNTLIFTGYTNMSGTGDVLLCKFPLMPMPPVIPNWTKLFERVSTNDCGYDLKQATVVAGYGVTGQTNPLISNTLDAFLMRTNLNGYVTPNCVDSVNLPVYTLPVIVDSTYFMDVPFMDVLVVPDVIHPIPVIRNLCILTNNNGNGTELPGKYQLMQNYPNPFNSFTNIQFAIPVSGNVSIKLYDITGRQVYTLINEYKETGHYLVSFNAADFPSGIYFYAMESNGFMDSKRMVLIK